MGTTTNWASHNWNICRATDPECEYCQMLVDDGVIISCDACYEPGHTDAPGGWNRDSDGLIYCDSCAEELGIRKT